MNKKIVAVTLLVLMSLGVAITPIIAVFGQNTNTGVSILQVIPASKVNIYEAGQSQDNGTVGTLMNLQGTLYTKNGAYNVIVGNDIVASGTSDGYYVDTNFTVPQLPSGGYNLILEDIKESDLNSTGTSPITFTVLTGYTVTPVPAYVEEGNSVTLDIAVGGGSPNTAYSANVTVTLPGSITESYWEMVSLGTSNNLGTASSQVTFPGSFQASSSEVTNATEYAGTYTAYFNQTEDLGSGTFAVGFLDSQTYHRGDTATVNAIGYASGQTVSFTVTSSSGSTTLVSPETLTASSAGVITTTFTLPSTTAVGNYNATITTTSGTAKLVEDKQTFSVPGYPVTITTLNLADEAVPNIVVTVQDPSAGTSYSGTSQINGATDFNLEPGPYNLTAAWNGVTVGQENINVNGAGNFNLQCKLTDLEIIVQTANGTTLPFVNLEITYSYGSSSSQTGNASGQTGATGTFTLNSTLTGVSYTILASIYNETFNVGNETVSSLPVQAFTTVVIICPTETLALNLVGYTNAPISGAQLELVELTNGLFYTASTDSSGSATIPVTFGDYRIEIYQNNILLNQTTEKVFGDTQDNIRCTLYDIQVSVSVVDYFGQPISNANVTVNGPSSERLSAVTPGDGTATFSNVIGGNLQIVAYAPGDLSNYQAVSLTVDSPASVTIKMGGYVAFGPFLIPTTALLTLILVLVGVILLVTFEVYMRRRHRAAAP